MITRRNFLFAAAALPLPPQPTNSTIARRVFDAVNFQRVCKYASPLTWDDRLAAVARQHCERMLALHFTGHEDPEFGGIGERLDRAGIAWLHCGENLFTERNFDDPVPIAVVSWMYSPGHRGNLLEPDFTASGIGVASDAEGRVAISQEFIRPR